MIYLSQMLVFVRNALDWSRAGGRGRLDSVKIHDGRVTPGQKMINFVILLEVWPLVRARLGPELVQQPEVGAGASSLQPPRPRILATISPSVWAGQRPGEEVRMGRVLEDGCWATVQSVLRAVLYSTGQKAEVTASDGTI